MAVQELCETKKRLAMHEGMGNIIDKPSGVALAAGATSLSSSSPASPVGCEAMCSKALKSLMSESQCFSDSSCSSRVFALGVDAITAMTQ